MSVASSLEKLDDWRRRELPAVAAPGVATVFTLVVLVLMYQRLRLAVDFTDESFSTALAYRFALGDRPFIDEVNSAQTAGILLWPFVWTYLKIVGSSSGLMLFTRLVFLAFKLGTGGIVLATIRRHLAWPLALVTALAAVVFVPHSIPNVGYNVLGSGLQMVGGFLAVRSYGETRQRRALFWSGVCNGLAIVAYPPLLVPAVVLGIVLFVTRTSTTRELGEFILGGAIIGLCMMPLLVAAGSANLHAMLELGGRLTPRPSSKIYDLALSFWAHSPVSMWLLPGLGVLIAALKLRPAWSVWALPILVAGLAFSFPLNISSTLNMTVYAGFFAPLFLVVLWDLPFCRALFYVVWIPSFVSGFITAFTSSNGEQNGGIGLHAGAMVFIVFEAIAVARLWREANPEARYESPVLMLGPIVLVLSMLAQFSFSVYRDDPTPALTVRVPSGPYKGLYTTAAKVRESAEIEQIFQRYGNPDGTVVALWEMPGAYLFSKMRPGLDTVWPAATSDQDALVRYYRAHMNGKGFAIHFGAPGKTTMPIEQLLETRGRPLEAGAKVQVTGDPAP